MKVTRELIERYHSGHCTEEEKRAVDQWLSSSKDQYDQLLDPATKDDMASEIWGSISPVVQSDSSGKVVPLYQRIGRYAAAVLFLSAIGFSWYYYTSRESISRTTQVADLYQTVQTQRGEKRTVTLPDGSTIRMNYETEIRVPERFEGDERVVYLTGHAHFDIARNPEKPFIIYTEDTKTQVLGTSFDINTKEEGETEVIVTNGKVAFSEKGSFDNQITLTVNDRAVLGSDKSMAIKEVNAQKLTAWKDNRLVFDGETLKEIIEVLEPWYDVKVTVEDPNLLTQDFRYTKDNPPLETVLDKLAFMGRFEYRIEGKNVTIH
ncbi:MAG: FecR domain-containing protein [Bacteroidota bacterium]